MSIHLRGTGGAPGIVLGQAARHLPVQARTIPQDSGIESALARFTKAQAIAIAELGQLAEQLRAEERGEEAAILEAHALLIEDPFLRDEVTHRLHSFQEPLEAALDTTIAQMRGSLQALDDPYLRERAADIDAVGIALHAALRGEQHRFDQLPQDAIIIAADLTPAETASLRRGTVAGFVTAAGGPNGHTAILARAFGIPAIVGLGAAALDIPDGTSMLLDGSSGLLIVDPEPAEQQREGLLPPVVQRQAGPATLADQHMVGLWANIGHPAEAYRALEYGATGIGLFRTEFLFLERNTPPSEEEQYSAYRAVLGIMGKRPVIVRTLDIGGDKLLPYIDITPEANPNLGIRGLRLCMQHPALFQAQLRALLRAAQYGDLRVMLPMVATLEDLAWGRVQLEAAAAALTAEGLTHRADLPFGVMIETPAAAVTADLLASKADFFSIGSNDLAQYTLAADRSSAELATRYSHHAPAVFRLIKHTVVAAVQAGIPVGLCGELAGEPEAAGALVGLGLDTLSMAPASIPAVRARLNEYTLPQAQAEADRVTTTKGTKKHE